VPRVQLQLVAPHRFYRAAPDLSRPELRNAYEQGRADRRTKPPNEALKSRMDLMKAGGPEVRRAYLLGHGPDRAAAPAPLALALPVIGAWTGLSAEFERRTGLRPRLRPAIALLLLTALSGPGFVRIGERRARALGLSIETAPVRHQSGSELLQLAIAAVHAVRYRLRRGSWRGDPAPTTTAAALVVRELMVHRSWRAAIRDGV